MSIILFISGLTLGTLLGMMIVCLLVVAKRVEAEDEPSLQNAARLRPQSQGNQAWG